MGEFVRLKIYTSKALAELDQNTLKKFEITTMVKNSGVEFPGDMGDSFGAELWVPQHQLSKAKEILNLE